MWLSAISTVSNEPGMLVCEVRSVSYELVVLECQQG